MSVAPAMKLLAFCAAATSANGFHIGPNPLLLSRNGALLLRKLPTRTQQPNIFLPSGTVTVHHSKHHHCAMTNSPAIMKMRPIFSQNVLSELSSSSSPMDFSSPSGRRHRTTAVYALILASVLSFVADKVIHLPIYRTMYLYHSNFRWWQPLTSTFCHGSWSHLSGNIFLLLLFGRSVEDELGPFGLVFSYIFCGVVANLVSLLLLSNNTVSLGASGAVFGLFSVSIFSRLSWRDIGNWRKIVEVGVLGQFVVGRFLDEAKTVAAGGVAGVNHVAHISGAGAGVVMILIMRKVLVKMER